jgi:iron complex transport system substrate-binding protein
MRKPTLFLLMAFLLLALLTGCVVPIANPPAAQASTDATPAAEGTEIRGDCEAGFRLFEHELLVGDPVCIPAAPQRVLPLDMAGLELPLLTGQTPVGTAGWMLEELPLLVLQFTGVLATLEGVGYPADLEQVAALQPDLILAPADTIDVKLASKIAPVVAPDPVIYEDRKIGMQFWAEVLNVPQMYTEMEANYFTRVAELQKALGQPADLKVSVISVSTYGVWLANLSAPSSKNRSGGRWMPSKPSKPFLCPATGGEPGDRRPICPSDRDHGHDAGVGNSMIPDLKLRG